jgi:hypothetical protein
MQVEMVMEDTLNDHLVSIDDAVCAIKRLEKLYLFLKPQVLNPLRVGWLLERRLLCVNIHKMITDIGDSINIIIAIIQISVPFTPCLLKRKESYRCRVK